MDHCTRKLLGLTDENLFFEEEWLETVEEGVSHQSYPCQT